MQKKIQFQSDQYTISGNLHLPAIKSPPIVIGSHGLLSSADSPKQIALAEACTENGIAYFRFSHRGCGKSSGDFASATSFEGRCRDVIRAVQIILDRNDTGNQIAMFGSSFGGAVILGVSHIFQTRAIVTAAAPVRLQSIRTPVITDPSEKSLLKSISTEKLSFDVSCQLPGISNILIFHGDADDVVPFSNALEIYDKTECPKKLIRQHSGDHPMGDPLHQKEFISVAADWFKNGFKYDVVLTAS
ncbi:MAG: alpha/beta hydrolase [Desulfobacterales bacterium]|jgi:hypothetical protein|nr:alpha/beta hydrolase [Desulfobacterales bacterium]